VVSARAGAKVYHVTRINGQVEEQTLEPEMIS